MSATALQIPAHRLQPTTVPPGPRRPSRPQLRVLEGGRAPSRLAQQADLPAPPARGRGRRAGARRGARPPGHRCRGQARRRCPLRRRRPPAHLGRRSERGRGGAPHVVVQPGDTLWTIAADVAPDADVRITVDQLIALNGASPIVPGQELVAPGV